jgi:hypothetical protein
LCKPDDLIVAVGCPNVKDDVLPAEERGEIADLKDLLKLIRCGFVHEIIPVGSPGMMYEAGVLAKDSVLRVNLELDEVEAKNSAGPATVVLVAISKNALNELSALIRKPMSVIGSFYR